MFVTEKEKVTRWWFSSKKMTVVVHERSDTIIFTSNITRKFIGQHIDNLERWMKKQGGFRKSKIGRE